MVPDRKRAADTWKKLGICTAALFFTFVIDLVAVRLGKEYLAKHGISTEHQVQVEQGLQVLHTQPHQPPSIPGDEGSGSRDVERGSTLSTTSITTTNEGAGGSVGMTAMAPADTKVVDYWTDQSENTPPGAQILGVAILEFGILFHSVCRSSSSPSARNVPSGS